MQIARIKCRVCKHSYHPNELLLGICAYCWKARSDAYINGKVQLDQYADGEVYRCFECKRPVVFGGYMQWVRDANTFALHCIKCSDAKYRADDQYRGTPFAFARKIQ